MNQNDEEKRGEVRYIVWLKDTMFSPIYITNLPYLIYLHSNLVSSVLVTTPMQNHYVRNRALLLTNTAPFSMSGTTMGMKPCRSQKKTHVFALLYINRIIISIHFADFKSNISTSSPVAAVCQGQSFGVQSEVGPPLLSDSRTCGLRHELDVCGRGTKYNDPHSY